jgi:hypothetical protein
MDTFSNVAIQGNTAWILLVAAFHRTVKRSDIFRQLARNSSLRTVGGLPPVK